MNSNIPKPIDIIGDIKFKEVDISQIDEVFRIIHTCAIDMNNKGKDHWINYYDSPEKLRHKFEEGKVFILYVDNIAVGTVSLSNVPPEYYQNNEDGPEGLAVDYVKNFSEPESKEVFYRSALAILPEYQGKKLGKKLIEMTEDYARAHNIRYIRFDTRNDYLLKYYEDNKYFVKGEMPDEDVIYYLVEKNLDAS